MEARTTLLRNERGDIMTRVVVPKGLTSSHERNVIFTLRQDRDFRGERFFDVDYGGTYVEKDGRWMREDRDDQAR